MTKRNCHVTGLEFAEEKNRGGRRSRGEKGEKALGKRHWGKGGRSQGRSRNRSRRSRNRSRRERLIVKLERDGVVMKAQKVV